MKDKTLRELITVRSQILLELHDKFQHICCNTSHLVSLETTSWHMLTLSLQPELKFYFDHTDFSWIFQLVCPNWKSLSSFWNWAMIFSHFHFKRISFFQKLGWNSPCHHPLSIYSFSCLAINSFFTVLPSQTLQVSCILHETHTFRNYLKLSRMLMRIFSAN